jgi:transcriptional regulator with XRE-family HTH domain
MDEEKLNVKIDKTNIAKILGKKIKQAREESRMSQLQLAVLLGLSDKTISGYETGRIEIPVKHLIQMGEIFKKPISYFIGADPREYKLTSRLRAVEISMREIRKQLNEIKLLCQTLTQD